jgi:hypothetical protein
VGSSKCPLTLATAAGSIDPIQPAARKLALDGTEGLEIESDWLSGAAFLVEDPEIGEQGVNRANVPHIPAG